MCVFPIVCLKEKYKNKEKIEKHKKVLAKKKKFWGKIKRGKNKKFGNVKSKIF